MTGRHYNICDWGPCETSGLSLFSICYKMPVRNRAANTVLGYCSLRRSSQVLALVFSGLSCSDFS